MATKKNRLIEMPPAASQTSAAAEPEQPLPSQFTSPTDEKPERHEYADVPTPAMPTPAMPERKRPLGKAAKTERNPEPPPSVASTEQANATCVSKGFRNKLTFAWARVRALPRWQRVALAGAVVAGGVAAYYLLQYVDQVFEIAQPAGEGANNVIPIREGFVDEVIREALENTA